MGEDRELRRVLWYVLGGSRGGLNRARMIQALKGRPMNLNQLAQNLEVDYRTAMHHAKVLATNSLVVVEGERYGATYFLSPRLESGYELFEEVSAALRFKLE